VQVNVHPVTWSLRLLWIALPVTAGSALAGALDDRSAAAQRAISISAWVLWGAVVVALAVPRPATLTIIRFGVPGAVPLAAWAVLDADWPVEGVVGLVIAVAAAVLALTAYVADDFVDGASYGDEQRFSLRAPGTLVAGPIPVVWAVGMAGIAAGPLVAAGSDGEAAGLLLAACVGIVGLGIGALALRSLHALATRIVVFVPAGMTLVDPLALAEAVLFARTRVVRLAPALADTTATDLSQKALGLALQVDLESPITLVVRDAARTASEVASASVVFTPGRPAAVLAAAEQRRITVG
jgi:hypothetical protein